MCAHKQPGIYCGEIYSYYGGKGLAGEHRHCCDMNDDNYDDDYDDDDDDDID